MADLADLLFATPGAVGGSPDDPCVHWRDRTLSRGEIVDAAERLADTLRAMGVAPDSAVVALVPPTPLGIVLRFGVWRAGAAVAALDATVEPPAFDALVEEVRPAAVLRPSLDETSLVAQVTVSPGEPRHYDEALAVIESTAANAAPAGAVRRVLGTHDAWAASLAAGEGTIRAGLVDVGALGLGSWVGADGALGAIGRGGAAALVDPYSAGALVEAVRRFAVESVTLTGAEVAALADEAAVATLEPLRYVRVVNDQPPTDVAREFRRRLGVLVLAAYGRPELGGEVVGWTLADARRHGDVKLGSVGRPYEGVGVEVRASDGQPVESDEHGEVWIRSPFAMHGLLSDRVDASVRLDGLGFLRTGHHGRLDDEGFLWIGDPER